MVFKREQNWGSDNDGSRTDNGSEFHKVGPENVSNGELAQPDVDICMSVHTPCILSAAKLGGPVICPVKSPEMLSNFRLSASLIYNKIK